MDLESTNGTLLNGEKIEPARYYELIKDDVINFGFSKRDYVIMK
jgi:smad nuclear-interacting protein 1